jgi:hypothetical protein
MMAVFRCLLAQRFWLLLTERDTDEDDDEDEDDGGGGGARCQNINRDVREAGPKSVFV